MVKSAIERNMMNFALEVTKCLKELNESIGLQSYPRLHIKIINLLTTILRKTKKFTEAIEELKVCLDLCREYGCPTSETLLNLGTVYIDTKDYYQGKAFSMSAAQEFVQQHQAGPNSSVLRMAATAYYNAGQCDMCMKDPVSAVNKLSLAVSLLTKLNLEKEDSLTRTIKAYLKETIKEARKSKQHNSSAVTSSGKLTLT